MNRTQRIAAWIGFSALVVLHATLRSPPEAPDRFGFPAEFANRMLWLLVAWAYLAYVALRLWPDDRGDG